jgi:cytidylate kinase
MMSLARATIPAKERGRPLVINTPRPIIITIDGPAGTGKSSVARALAKRLGLDFLDTGAMYRAAAAIVLDHSLPRADVPLIIRTIAAADLKFDWAADPPQVLAWDRALEDRRLRAADVTDIVSDIASIAELRRHMVAKQRLIAEQHRRLVTEGRDQGSVVFPDAAVKFYLDAAPQERARRRAEQLRARGITGPESEERALLQEIVERDASDSGRAVGPLVCPQDAVRIDTTGLSFEQVVDVLEDEVRERVAAF